MNRPSKISNLDVAASVQEKVLRLDVSVDNPVVVHVLEADQDASYEKLSLLLIEALLSVMMVSEIASRHKISHQVDVFKVSECIKHVY